MKKIFVYSLIGIAIVCFLKILFIKEEVEEVASMQIEKFDYGEYNSIRLLHVEDGSVENLDLDTYLLGVVSSEMPATFEQEALKAQSIVARTYTIYQIKNSSKHENADLCDNSNCCQAWISKENRFSRWEEDKKEEYWSKIEKAVFDTKGKIILFQNEPINALFHSNSGGKTELAINVWGGDMPYFKTIETSGEEEYSSFKSEAVFSKDEFVKIMFEKYPDFQINFEEPNFIQIIELTESDRVKKIKIGNKELSGVEARKLFNLKSSKFNFEIGNDFIKFFVYGYGHGVRIKSVWK